MKNKFLKVKLILIVLSIFVLRCSEDPTPSIFDFIEPSDKLPVERLFDFETKTTGVPYAVATDDAGVLYVSIDQKGIKKIIADSLVVFAPYSSNAPFFRSITMASDGKLYGIRTGIRGVYVIAENTAAATFLSSAQGVSDKLADIEFDKSNNILWAGGNVGELFSFTLDKSVKKFIRLAGNIKAMKIGFNNLYVALTDTFDNEVVWKFPVISKDSLGTGELLFNLTEKVDTVAEINEITLDQDGHVYLFTDKAGVEMIEIQTDKTYTEPYNGLFIGTTFSFAWGDSNIAYFTNILSGKTTDVWKIDMKKNKGQ